MTDEEKLVEKLAKAMYESASAVTFVGGLTIEEQWEVVDQDERDLCYAHARAALAHLEYERVKARAELCEEMKEALVDALEALDEQKKAGREITSSRAFAREDVVRILTEKAPAVLAQYDALVAEILESQRS